MCTCGRRGESDAAEAELTAEGDEAGDEEWDVAHDDSGTPYFVNRVSGESVWEKPEGFRYDITLSVPLYISGLV